MDGEGKATQHTAKMRIVLQCYEQQLLSARRLAKFKARARAREGLDMREPDPVHKRNEFVGAVAREMLNSLIFTGISAEMMEDIRKELCKRLKMEFEFVFPPNSNLCIYVHDGGKRRPLTVAEQEAVGRALSVITSAKVDKSMQNNSPRAGLYC